MLWVAYIAAARSPLGRPDHTGGPSGSPVRLHPPGLRALYEHVRVFEEAVGHLAALVGFQVQRDASLVPVDRIEVFGDRRDRPAAVAPSDGLDLDDVGAHVTEGLRREWAGDDLRQIDDGHTVQGQDAGVRLDGMHTLTVSGDGDRSCV
jgi:hypothetical protein